MYILNQFESSSNATGMILKLTNFPQNCQKNKIMTIKTTWMQHSLARFEKKTKTCDKNVYFFVCFKNANNCNFVCFLFLKTLLKMTVWEIVFPQQASSCKIHCFKKHIFPMLEKSFQKPQNILHNFAQIFRNLHSFCFHLKKNSNLTENWKQCLHAIQLCSKLNKQFKIQHKKQQPKLGEKNFAHHNFFRECVHWE